MADENAGERLYYTLAKETEGKIYLTNKPDHPDELLRFLLEEITLGKLQH